MWQVETPFRHLGAAFEPKKKDFKLALPPQYSDLEPAVVDLLAAYQIERHIRKDTDEKPNRLKKEITLSAGFEALWNRIKLKTTYRVEFQTDTLAARAIAAIKKMEKVEPPKIKVTAGRVEVRKAGVAAEAVSAAEWKTEFPLSPPHNLQPRYNVCPTDPIDVVTERDGKRDLVRMRWGLVPWWWSKPLRAHPWTEFDA